MDARLAIGSRAHQLFDVNTTKVGQQREGGVERVSFESLFQNAMEPKKDEELRISSHAQKRLTERSIDMGAELKSSLKDALNELEAKGAKNSLVITNEGAFVMNVPNRTLVTAMGFEEMRDGIVTNIDSVNMKFA
jgi:flagellar operon protein